MASKALQVKLRKLKQLERDFARIVAQRDRHTRNLRGTIGKREIKIEAFIAASKGHSDKTRELLGIIDRYARTHRTGHSISRITTKMAAELSKWKARKRLVVPFGLPQEAARQVELHHRRLDDIYFKAEAIAREHGALIGMEKRLA
jgi:hypothetical protein